MKIAPVCLALLLAGCADEGSDHGPKEAEPPLSLSVPVLDAAPADMHALVPADASVYVQAVSLEALKDAVAAYQRLIDSPDVIQDPREWLAGLGLFDPSRVDCERPCALAVGAPDDQFPVTIIVGSSDAGALGRTAPLGIGVRTQGDYVAFSPFEEPAELGSPLTADLPAGSLAGRVDLLPLVDAGRVYLEMAMGLAQMQAASMEGAGPVDTVKAMEASAAMMRGVMDAVESLEFSVGQDGPEVAFRGALTVKDGGPFAGFTPPTGGNLADVASRLDPGATLVMLGRADMGEVMDRCEEPMRLMMAAYFTEPAGDHDLDEMMGAWSALYRLGLGTFGGTFSMDEDVRGWYLAECSNPAAAVRTYSRLVEEGMFNMPYAEITPLSTSTVDGVEVTTFQTTLDAEKLYAGIADPRTRDQMLQSLELMGGSLDRWLTHLMHSGGLMGMTFGGQDPEPDAALVERISRPEGPVPPALADLVEELDAHDAGFALRFDLAAFMELVLTEVNRSQGDWSPGPVAWDGRAMLTTSAAVTGNRWDLGCRLDLGSLLDLVKAMQSARVRR